jgi:hypothetical protein
MDMWTMRLRRTGHSRGQRDALPTAASFAHMPTALYLDKTIKSNDNFSPGNIPS